jgi:hypothetical protein
MIKNQPSSYKPQLATHGEALAGQTGGAFGLSLTFCFFCVKAKEKKLPLNLNQIQTL